jgi:hypothetical protein
MGIKIPSAACTNVHWVLWSELRPAISSHRREVPTGIQVTPIGRSMRRPQSRRSDRCPWSFPLFVRWLRTFARLFSLGGRESDSCRFGESLERCLFSWRGRFRFFHHAVSLAWRSQLSWSKISTDADSGLPVYKASPTRLLREWHRCLQQRVSAPVVDRLFGERLGPLAPYRLSIDVRPSDAS